MLNVFPVPTYDLNGNYFLIKISESANNIIKRNCVDDCLSHKRNTKKS